MANFAKPVTVNGELFWSRWMNEVNTQGRFYNASKPKYECTIGNLSKAAAQALTALNIHVKEKAGHGLCISGKSNYPFTPTGANGEEISPQVIGNGTKCIALVGSYEHPASAANGFAASISSIKVTELVTYGGADVAVANAADAL